MFRIKMFESRSTAASPRRRAGGVLLDRLRSAKRPRPLQISEVVQAVDEHLRAAALPSLGSRYLPTFLTVRVSADDWRGLSPFEDHLRATIRETYDRLSEQPRLAALAVGPRVEFFPSAELALGAAPELMSDFPQRLCEASWRPGKRVPSPVTESCASVASAAGGILEAVVTRSPRRGTARQSAITVCLASELALRLLDPGAAERARLRLDERGEIVGGTWRGDSPEVLSPSSAASLRNVDGSATGDPDPAYRFRRAHATDLLWAPGGTVILGREPATAHWVPERPPPNLSGAHLALTLGADGDLEVVDLGSTNGTYLGGERLPASRRAPLRLPAGLEVGREGVMRVELLPLVPPASAARPDIGPPEPERTLEESR